MLFNLLSKMEQVHYKWIIGVGAVVICILIALLFCNIDCETHPIMRFLSLTATILSIMLSVFSILFSWYSMTSSSRQWNNMTNAISAMKEANENIRNNNESLLQKVIDITRDVSALRSRVDQVGQAQGNNNPSNELLAQAVNSNANNVVGNQPQNQPEQQANQEGAQAEP